MGDFTTTYDEKDLSMLILPIHPAARGATPTALADETARPKTVLETDILYVEYAAERCMYGSS